MSGIWYYTGSVLCRGRRSAADRGSADTLLKMEYPDRPPKTDPPRSDGCHLKHINPITGKDVLLFLPVSMLSTQHAIYPTCQLNTPQYQNQPLNSPLFFTVDQFPPTRKMKKSGNRNLSPDKP